MKEMTCLECPRGCQLSIDESTMEVTGNSCPKGEAFARAEITNPVRVLTSTVVLESRADTMLPVRTLSPIPKASMFAAMRYLKTVKAYAPVDVGDIIVKDIVDTGVPVIATKKSTE